MVANVGYLDRVMRLVVGALLIIAPLITSTAFLDLPAARLGLPIVGGVFLLTALVRFCPLYRILGLATCQTQSNA